MKIKFFWLVAFALAAASNPAHATMFEGKSFEETRVVQNSPLVLNGVGKRVVIFFDAYYASLYLPRQCTSFPEVMDLHGKRQLEIRLLRDVRLSMLESVFVDGIEKNVNASELVMLKPSMDALLTTMRRIKTFNKSDVLRLTFNGEGTQVELNGTLVGAPIGNKAFNNALLAIWIGRSPIDQALKERLLGAQ